MAVASLVLGILALVFSCFGQGWLTIILGIVGIILGAIGRKNPAKKGMATAGLVLSIIAIAWGIIVLIACVACVGGMAGMESMYY